MATKKAAAKKAPAKKAAAKAESGRSREAIADRDDKLMTQIQKDRDGGAKWSEIADKYRITAGKAIFLYDRATVPRKERITGETDKELGQAIVHAREQEGMSWGKIAVRANMGEGAARTLYAKYSKNPDRGARIGKGGRYPGDAKPATNGIVKTAKTTKVPAAKKTPAKKAPAKKAAAKKAVDSGHDHPLQGKSKAEVAKRLEGKEVKLGRVSGELSYTPTVKKVLKVSSTTIRVQYENGETADLDLLDTKGTRSADD